MSDQEKEVDESWKETASVQKDVLGDAAGESSSDEKKIFVKDSIKREEEPDEGKSPETAAQASKEQSSHGEVEINFLNYVTSLGFQVMVFLGEIPHPATNQIEKNLEQSKLLIDTLTMLRDKTKGNLTEQEDNLLSASIYELQLKYVEAIQKEKSSAGEKPGE